MTTRIAVLALAAACLAWAVIVAPAALGSRAMSQLGRRIAVGETFRQPTLERMLETPPRKVAGIACYAPDLRGRMLAAARLAELAISGNQMQQINPSLAAARARTLELLSCEPYDSQGWLVLYWTTGHLEGFGGRVFDLLAMSYRTGPLEGWVAFRRNPQAVFAFGALPEEMRALVLNEWRHLVTDWLPLPAAISLERIAPEYRQNLLGERRHISDATWLSFSQYLEKRGSPITLPDVPETPR